MSQDEVPTVDPDNEKGKLELVWIVVIAVVLVVIALAVWRFSGRSEPPQTGLIAPRGAAVQNNRAPAKSVVPAH